MTLTSDGFDVLDIPDGAYEGRPEWVGMIRSNTNALLAATFPARPPSAWFGDPFLREPTPLTVDDNGRVYGHIATWHTSHIGLAGGVKPPRSKSRYAFFATGALKTAENDTIPVGQLTLSGGHAPLDVSVAEAVAHYDNTSSAFADVAVGEDKVGIWVAGALRPEVDELKLRSIRASSVSGDWRPISGNLELVAVCAVNVPGFPIPRARVASGATLALVAAGTEELVRAAVLDRADVDIADGIFAGLSLMDERLAQVESALLDRSLDRRANIGDDDVEAAVQRVILRQRVHGNGEPESEPELDVQSLRDRVHGAPEPTVAPDADELRKRVHGTDWDDGEDITWTVDEVTTAALRARVHSGVQGTATTALTAEKRRKGAKSGAALPDGAYPIFDKRDVAKAVRALGRGVAAGRSAATLKKHIMKRAKALGAMDAIPDSWKK